MHWHRGKTIWFTGLSGSGKSTLSSMINSILAGRGVPVVLLDGDLLRSGLNRDLGFSAIDRAENIRRAGELAKLFSDTGHTVIAAFITPLETLRQALRNLFEPDRYVEIYLDCPLSVCESRDPKGLYCKARRGEIPEFTGVSAPFEIPSAADLVVPTGDQRIEESMHTVLSWLESRFSDLSGQCSPAPLQRRGGLNERRVAVIGLDGMSPREVFGDVGKTLPNLRGLIEHGLWGSLRSTDPPITIPAWTSMTTGKDPGELGLYGFRNRTDYGYRDMFTANATHVAARRVWDHLEQAGGTSILLGIPQTYPPQPHNGITVGGFPVPDSGICPVYPPDLEPTLSDAGGGEYLPDVREFRTHDKERLLRDLYIMTERRFRVACDFLSRKPWDFFMMVEIAPDRLHHGFWERNEDSTDPGSVIREFYRYLDAWVGALLSRLGDDTTVLVVSDHGVRSMYGGLCINEWLMREGLLALKVDPDRETPLTHDMIDWTKTKVWSEGGYYARIFFNVKGREPQGLIEPAEYEEFREELADRLSTMKGDDGTAPANRVLKPDAVYRECRGIPPDLMVYPDDLNRRAVGSVGHGKIMVPANDTGPDAANHDLEGIFIMTRVSDLRAGSRLNRRIEGATCLDVTPTILREFGLVIPGDLSGGDLRAEETQPSKPVAAGKVQTGESRLGTPAGFTPEEEEAIKKRLTDLGYL